MRGVPASIGRLGLSKAIRGYSVLSYKELPVISTVTDHCRQVVKDSTAPQSCMNMKTSRAFANCCRGSSSVELQTQERIFLIIVALAGAVVFSYCMGTISSLLTEVDTVRLHGCESLFPWHPVISYNRLKVSKTDVPD